MVPPEPELSLEEVQTTEHIAAELQKMGYTEIQRFPDHTGLCAMLRGGKAEKACRTVALRADIDALPVEEKTGLPFASRNKASCMPAAMTAISPCFSVRQRC